MFAVGLPERNRHHGVVAALAALLFKKSVSELNIARSEHGQEHWMMRVGLNSGAAMAEVSSEKISLSTISGGTQLI